MYETNTFCLIILFFKLFLININSIEINKADIDELMK